MVKALRKGKEAPVAMKKKEVEEEAPAVVTKKKEVEEEAPAVVTKEEEAPTATSTVSELGGDSGGGQIVLRL